MIRPAIAEGPNKTIVADFSKPDPNRPFELKDVKWVIGHRWKQRFIGVVNGQEVVFPGAVEHQGAEVAALHRKDRLVVSAASGLENALQLQALRGLP